MNKQSDSGETFLPRLLSNRRSLRPHRRNLIEWLMVVNNTGSVGIFPVYVGLFSKGRWNTLVWKIGLEGDTHTVEI
jgi:hypothetical protein